MKKNLLTMFASGLMLLSACGPSAEERAAEQKRIQDSIAEAQRLAEEAMRMEQQRIQDSIAAAMEQQRIQDSIRMAEEEAAKRKKAAAKPKPKPETKAEEPKGTGITKGGVEIKKDGQPATTEPPRITKGGQPIGGQQQK